MLKIGIAIDDWKLPIFERHLSGAGYSFEQVPGLSSGTILLTVMVNSVEELKTVARAANTEAAKKKGKLR